MDTKQFTAFQLTVMFNHLTVIGARTEMRSLRVYLEHSKGKGTILDYLGHLLGGSLANPNKVQLFLEYVYLGNRVGKWVSEGILDRDTILSVWPAGWWINTYEILEPLIQTERENRKDNQLYSNFESFIKEVCEKNMIEG